MSLAVDTAAAAAAARGVSQLSVANRSRKTEGSFFFARPSEVPSLPARGGDDHTSMMSIRTRESLREVFNLYFRLLSFSLVLSGVVWVCLQPMAVLVTLGGLARARAAAGEPLGLNSEWAPPGEEASTAVVTGIYILLLESMFLLVIICEVAISLREANSYLVLAAVGVVVQMALRFTSYGLHDSESNLGWVVAVAMWGVGLFVFTVISYRISRNLNDWYIWKVPVMNLVVVFANMGLYAYVIFQAYRSVGDSLKVVIRLLVMVGLRGLSTMITLEIVMRMDADAVRTRYLHFWVVPVNLSASMCLRTLQVGYSSVAVASVVEALNILIELKELALYCNDMTPRENGIDSVKRLFAVVSGKPRIRVSPEFENDESQMQELQRVYTIPHVSTHKKKKTGGVSDKEDILFSSWIMDGYMTNASGDKRPRRKASIIVTRPDRDSLVGAAALNVEGLEAIAASGRGPQLPPLRGRKRSKSIGDPTRASIQESLAAALKASRKSLQAAPSREGIVPAGSNDSDSVVCAEAPDSGDQLLKWLNQVNDDSVESAMTPLVPVETRGPHSDIDSGSNPSRRQTRFERDSARVHFPHEGGRDSSSPLRANLLPFGLRGVVLLKGSTGSVVTAIAKDVAGNMSGFQRMSSFEAAPDLRKKTLRLLASSDRASSQQQKGSSRRSASGGQSISSGVGGKHACETPAISPAASVGVNGTGAGGEMEPIVVPIPAYEPQQEQASFAGSAWPSQELHLVSLRAAMCKMACVDIMVSEGIASVVTVLLFYQFNVSPMGTSPPDDPEISRTILINGFVSIFGELVVSDLLLMVILSRTQPGVVRDIFAMWNQRSWKLHFLVWVVGSVGICGLMTMWWLSPKCPTFDTAGQVLIVQCEELLSLPPS